MTTIDRRHRRPRAPPIAPPRSSSARPPSGRCCCRDAYVLRTNLKEFLPRTLMQPLLLVFVFTYVLPEDRAGHRRRRAAAPARPPRCSSPA